MIESEMWPFNFKWHMQTQVLQIHYYRDSLASLDKCVGAPCVTII